MNDDEFAEAWLKTPQSSQDPAPPWSEYTPVVARLDAVVDRIGELTATLVAVQPKQKFKPPRPSKRPETALHRARQRSRASSYASLVSEVAEAQERYAATHN